MSSEKFPCPEPIVKFHRSLGTHSNYEYIFGPNFSATYRRLTSDPQVRISTRDERKACPTKKRTNLETKWEKN